MNVSKNASKALQSFTHTTTPRRFRSNKVEFDMGKTAGNVAKAAGLIGGAVLLANVIGLNNAVAEQAEVIDATVDVLIQHDQILKDSGVKRLAKANRRRAKAAKRAARKDAKNAAQAAGKSKSKAKKAGEKAGKKAEKAAVKDGRNFLADFVGGLGALFTGAPAAPAAKKAPAKRAPAKKAAAPKKAATRKATTRKTATKASPVTRV